MSRIPSVRKKLWTAEKGSSGSECHFLQKWEEVFASDSPWSRLEDTKYVTKIYRTLDFLKILGIWKKGPDSRIWIEIVSLTEELRFNVTWPRGLLAKVALNFLEWRKFKSWHKPLQRLVGQNLSNCVVLPPRFPWLSQAVTASCGKCYVPCFLMAPSTTDNKDIQLFSSIIKWMSTVNKWKYQFTSDLAGRFFY